MILRGINRLELDDTEFDYVTIGRPHYEEVSDNPDALSMAARFYRSMRRKGQDPHKLITEERIPGRIKRAIDELGDLELILNPHIQMSDGKIDLYGGDLWMLSPDQVILRQNNDYITVTDIGSSYGTALNGLILGVNKDIRDIRSIGTSAIPPSFNGEARISNEATISLAYMVLQDNYAINVRPEK